VVLRLVVVWLGVLAGVSVAAAPPEPPPQSDLDAFMAAVIERRDENWKKLQQYILDEREVVQLRGPGRIPLWGDTRDYSWYIRDGFFVRSPVRANGVNVPEPDRLKYEEEYLERARTRDEREREQEAAAAADAVPAQNPPVPADAGGLLAQVGRPQFVDSAYFLKFKFETGRYAFVGLEAFEGREVLRIEYYPEKLFANDRDDRSAEPRRQRRRDDPEETFDRMMNKVSLVTLWVEPASRQIVKYTFDNVNLDFLPAAWLARVTDLTAVMTMSQPFPDVWLPRDIEFYFGFLLAIGSFDIHYRLDYHDYREAKGSGRIKRTAGWP